MQHRCDVLQLDGAVGLGFRRERVDLRIQTEAVVAVLALQTIAILHGLRDGLKCRLRCIDALVIGVVELTSRRGVFRHHDDRLAARLRKVFQPGLTEAGTYGRQRCSHDLQRGFTHRNYVEGSVGNLLNVVVRGALPEESLACRVKADGELRRRLTFAREMEDNRIPVGRP